MNKSHYIFHLIYTHQKICGNVLLITKVYLVLYIIPEIIGRRKIGPADPHPVIALRSCVVCGSVTKMAPGKGPFVFEF